MKSNSLLTIVYLFASYFPLYGQDRLINGTVVDPNEWLAVFNMGGCTATVVGPRAIATASHCVNPGQNRLVKIAGNSYQVKTYRHPKYSGASAYSHDIAIGISDKEITGVTPVSFKLEALNIGDTVTILGFGCTKPGGGGSDGKLRMGDTKISSFNGTDMVLKKSGGAAVCYGDSGGPNMQIEENRRQLVGITSKGNISNTSYNLRVGIEVIENFLEEIAAEKKIEICGINLNCS